MYSGTLAASGRTIRSWPLATGLLLVLAAGASPSLAQFEDDDPPVIEEPAEDPSFTPFTPDLDIKSVSVRHHETLGVLAFQMTVRGTAGKTKPEAIGSRDGAPVLAYVFKTDLSPRVVGFRDTKGGTLALAVTTHPDFDCSPLWDENGDGVYTNDGSTYQAHWMVLVENESLFVAPNYGVRSTVPPTAPKMPFYVDSPGFNVVLDDDTLRVIVPTARIGGRTSAKVTGMTAFMRLGSFEGDDASLVVEHVYDERDASGIASTRRDAGGR